VSSSQPDQPAAQAVAAGPPCPRCGARLINPDSLGWCAQCGYCQSLEDEAAKGSLEKAAPRKASLLGVVEFADLLMRIPVWVYVLLTGVIAIVMTAFYVDAHLPVELSFGRAFITTITVGVSVVGIFVAQVWAMMLIVAEEDGLGARDLFISFKLWRRTLRRLPATRKPVWLGTWALTALLAALFVIGGLEFWLQNVKPKKLAKPRLTDLIALMEVAEEEGGDDSLEDAIRNLAGDGNLKKKDDGKDLRPTTECAIIGYMIKGDRDRGELSGLVLATLKDDKLVYAGICRAGWTPEATQELAEKFPKLVRPTPFLRGLKLEATWLQPEVLCEVHNSGWDSDGTILVNPVFKALLRPQDANKSSKK
jgi:hypothetical protein